VVTPLQKQIDQTFSQSWQIYRVAFHEKGGQEMACDMSWKYSTKDLYDILERFDVYDALKEEARKKAEAASKNKPR